MLHSLVNEIRFFNYEYFIPHHYSIIILELISGNNK